MKTNAYLIRTYRFHRLNYRFFFIIWPWPPLKVIGITEKTNNILKSHEHELLSYDWIRVRVCNITFNDISAISWKSVLLVHSTTTLNLQLFTYKHCLELFLSEEQRFYKKNPTIILNIIHNIFSTEVESDSLMNEKHVKIFVKNVKKKRMVLNNQLCNYLSIWY